MGKRGCYVRTDAFREKASITTKKYHESHEHPRGMLGKSHSDESKIKIGESNKGKIRSPETIQKMIDNHVGMTGKQHSGETKKKMSITRSGKKRPPFTDEHRRKIGLANKGRIHSEETKKKISEASKGRKWTKEHIENFSESRKGANHPCWKGGRCKSHGYVYILQPNHPFCDKSGRIFEHRLVMEKHLNRILVREEVIHHINGILDDNRIENLKLFPDNKTHMKFHYETRRKVLKEYFSHLTA